MSCEDIPSLLDLQNTKKHADDFGRLMGTGTGTSTNGVTGQVRPTYNKVIEQLGFKPGSGDFTTGFTVMPGERDIAWLNPVDNNWYSYLGVIPTNGHQVLPGTDPTVGGEWKPVTNAIEYDLLRQELADETGSAMIGTPYGKNLSTGVLVTITYSEITTKQGVETLGVLVPGVGSYSWNSTSTATPDGLNIIAVTGVTTGRWVRDGVATTFADLRTKEPTSYREILLHEHRAGFKHGGGVFYWDATSTESDNGGTIATVSGVTTGRWKRRYINLTADMFGLPKTGDCLAELQAIEAIQYATGVDCYFNIDGVYETIGEVNWPWRQATVPAASFKDYKGARLVCKGSGVVFKTTSATGADILQLNSISNFSVIGWPTLTATLTTTANAGSNGVSVTNGGKNVYCEIEAKDLPFTVKPTYLDGGKAITIQNGAGTLLPYQNVRLVCRRAENCAYGATVDIATQPLVSQQNWYGNVMGVTAIDCYRAAQVSADSPTEGTVPSNGLNMGLDIRVDALNCQQDYVESRGWCINTAIRTQRNKGTAGLIGKNPNDTQVFVDKVVASLGGSLSIDGSVTSVDYLHGVGGLITSNGNSATRFKDFRYNVRYQGALASNLQVFTIDAGGNTVTSCTFNILGTVGFSTAPLVTAGNSCFVNGVATLRGMVTQ